MNYCSDIIKKTFSLKNKQFGGEFDFDATGSLISKKFSSFKLDENDLHNIREFEKIMPKIQLEGFTCGTELKKDAIEISMGGFGLLFRFLCVANEKKYSMKIGLPNNIRNANNWALYNNEHVILNRFGNTTDNETNGILLPKYFGRVDLTGLNPRSPGKLEYTETLFPEEINKLDFKFPSRIIIFFQEWLDGDLNRQLSFPEPLDVLNLFYCLLLSLNILVKDNKVHSDLKGGNIMFKNLPDIDLPASKFYDAHKITSRKLYKIIDLGAVVENGRSIMSYTGQYLDPESAELIDAKNQKEEEIESLKKTKAPPEIIERSVSQLEAIPNAGAFHSQDIYALGLSIAEILLNSQNSRSKNVRLTDNLNKHDYDSENDNVIENAFNLEFSIPDYVLDKEKWSGMNKYIVSFLKELLRQMLKERDVRISCPGAIKFLEEKIISDEMLAFVFGKHFSKNYHSY